MVNLIDPNELSKKTIFLLTTVKRMHWRNTVC